jgi:hypothetical protein
MRSSSSKPSRCWRARTDRIRRCRGGWHAKGVRSQHMAPAHLARMAFRPTPASSACCASDLSIRLLCYMKLEWPRFLLTHLLSNCTDYCTIPNDHQPFDLPLISWTWTWTCNRLLPPSHQHRQHVRSTNNVSPYRIFIPSDVRHSTRAGQTISHSPQY